MGARVGRVFVAMLVGLGLSAGSTAAATAATTVRLVVRATPTAVPPYTTNIDIYDQTGVRKAFYSKTGGLQGDTSGTYFDLEPGVYDITMYSNGPSNRTLPNDVDGYSVRLEDVDVSANKTVYAPTPPGRRTLEVVDTSGNGVAVYAKLTCKGAEVGGDPATVWSRWESFSRSASSTQVLTGYDTASGCALRFTTPTGLTYNTTLRFPAEGPPVDGDGNEIPLVVTVPDRDATITGTFNAPASVTNLSASVKFTTATGWSGTSAAIGRGPWSLTMPSGPASVEVGGGDNSWSVDQQRQVTVTDGLSLGATPTTVRAALHSVTSDGSASGMYATMQCRLQDSDVTTQITSAERVIGGPLDLPYGPGWSCRAVWFPRDPDGLTGSAALTSRSVTPAATGNEWTVVDDTGELVDGSRTSTTDADGVSNAVEAGAPHGGDGNNDGVPDAEQPNVTSLPAAVGGGYVTVAAPAGTALAGVRSLDPANYPAPPAEVTALPHGLTAFALTGVPVGSDQTVTVFTGDTTGVTGYAKYDENRGTWSTLPADRVTVLADRVQIRLTDGGVGDDDNTADGTIVDPGGPATLRPRDTTPPVVTGAATTQPNANGWYNGDVTVHWTATDADSGVAAQPADTVVTGEGSALSAQSAQVCDTATPANCTTGTLSGLKIDRTKPTLALSGPQDGASYTLGAAPAATCSASDALSGLASPCTITTTGGNASKVGLFTTTARATDLAGNVTTVTRSYRVTYRFVGFQRPLNDPSLNPSAPMSVYPVGSSLVARLELTDAKGKVVAPVSAPTWVAPTKQGATKAKVNEIPLVLPASPGTSFTRVLGAWQFIAPTKTLTPGFVYRLSVKLDDGTTHTVDVGLR